VTGMFLVGRDRVLAYVSAVQIGASVEWQLKQVIGHSAAWI